MLILHQGNSLISEDKEKCLCCFFSTVISYSIPHRRLPRKFSSLPFFMVSIHASCWKIVPLCLWQSFTAALSPFLPLSYSCCGLTALSSLKPLVPVRALSLSAAPWKAERLCLSRHPTVQAMPPHPSPCPGWLPRQLNWLCVHFLKEHTYIWALKLLVSRAGRVGPSVFILVPTYMQSS